MEITVPEHSNLNNQQPAYDSQNGGLYECSRMSSYSFLKSPREKKPNQPSTKQLVQNGTKGKFTSFYCKDLHVPWALWFHVLSLFSAQQLNLFSQSDKVSMPGRCSLILSEMHILLAFLHVLLVSALEWQCSEMWRNTTDNRMWLMCAHPKHYKCYKTLWQGRFCHLLWFLNLSDNRNQPYETYEKYDCGKDKLSYL